MKKSILLILAMLPFIMVFGQSNAEGFLAAAPTISNPCPMSNKQMDEYRSQIGALAQLLRDLIDKREAESDEIAERGDVNVGVLKQQGLKNEDAEKIRSEKDMSDAERDALADKAIKQKMNMSMEDLNKVVAMNDKGQENWAKGEKNEAMANVPADPKKNQNKQLKSKSIYELALEENKLSKKLTEAGEKYGDMFIELDEDAAEAKEVLEPKLDKLRDKIKDIKGAGFDTDNGIYQERLKAIYKEIDALNDNYCMQFTPRYVDILDKYRAYLTSALPDYYRLEEVSNQHTKALSGIKYNITTTGTVPLKAVDLYMGRLSDVFKYRKDKKIDEEQ